ncbi:MAG: ferrous iron transport protein B [Proteobacteria bacterium]|nr:ferrous iron transport protein B [Pseudomonadota bacterium]
MPTKLKVALIGNPNCGKTTLFNAIAGQNKKTGNWAGVTVSESKALISHKKNSFDLIDLPGLYALSLEDMSQDEQIVIDAIGKNDIDIFVNVINASSLEKNLFLTTELLELEKPVVLVLNMSDEMLQKGYAVDAVKLSELTGCKVLFTTATKGKGLNQLMTAISQLMVDSKKTAFGFAELPQDIVLPKAINRAAAIDQYLQQSTDPEADSKKIFDARFAQSLKLASLVQKKGGEGKPSGYFNLMDKLLTHPVTGILGFLLVMYLMFFFAINVANVFIDFFDIATGAIFINGSTQLFELLHFPQWLIVLLSDGVGGGIQTVATFIPVIGFLFLFLTLLEESGYMARAAFVMNDWLQTIGLSGKAFVPLIISFGCNVPAIMAARGLTKKDERIITTLMAPFMSCGARLSVYALFVAAFFTENAALIVLSLYLIGILVAVLTGLLMRKTILPGKPDPFIIELPKWRFPGVKYVLASSWHKLRSFIVDAGKIIIVIVVILQVISSLGKDLSWGNKNSDNSILAAGAQMVTPIFKPMGIHQDNWPAVVGLFTGLLAKEVMVGALDSIYSSQLTDDEQLTIKEELTQAVVSIKHNSAGLLATLTDPLGLSLTDVSSDGEMAENQGVSKQLFGIIREKFIDGYAAFAYLLFVLLYFPCVTAVAAISKESGKKWATFSALYSTSIAYIIATGFYQVVTFSEHALFSSLWLTGSVLALFIFYFFLKRSANSISNKIIPLKIK